MTVKVFASGATKKLGFYVAKRLLESGATVTFLARNPATFEQEDEVKAYIQSGQARVVKGDAFVVDDVRKAWIEAGKGEREGEVDIFIHAVGGTEASVSPFTGVKITNPATCTLSFLTAIRALPDNLRAPGKQPKIIAISSKGVTNASWASLPLPWKLVYWWMLSMVQTDKAGLEGIAAHIVGRPWAADDKDETSALIGGEWKALDGVPAAGSLPNVVLVRPLVLTDGESTAKYRVSKTDDEHGFYTISRKDVAHFVVDDVIAHWDDFKGKTPSIAY